MTTASEMQGNSMPAVEAGDEIAAGRRLRGAQEKRRATGRDRGEGPFARLVLRGATVIDGTGAPPWGPVDIVIEGDRIAEMRGVGAPRTAIDPAARPAAGEHEIDCHGKFVTPGFVDAHAHIGSPFVGSGWPTA